MRQTISETTRYISAAIQLDRSFCNWVYREFFEKDIRVIGISHDIDIDIVLRSCLLARKRREKLKIFLLTLFALLIILTMIFLTNNVILFYLYSLIYGVTLIAIVSDQLSTRYKIVGQNFSKNNFTDEKISQLLNFPLDKKIQIQLEERKETQKANVIIYGGFSPFVGAGLKIDNLSFLVDISKGKNDIGKTFVPLPFKTTDIFEYVDNSISKLKLQGLCTRDNLYISGSQLRDQKELLVNKFVRPITKLEDSKFQDIIENPRDSIRHYRCVEVTDYQRKIVLSVFYRFSMTGQSLFTEVSYHLLTPIKSYYRECDCIKKNASVKDIFNMIRLNILTPFTFFILPKWRSSQKIIKERNRKEIESNINFNYGAFSSLRELISSNEFTHFQKSDQEMYLKAIERKIVDSLSEFLDSKNIDTSDFKETKSVIMNHGVIGSIHAQSVGIGEKSNSISTKFSIQTIKH